MVVHNVEIVILANSVKHRQHCVAGKTINDKQWIRPVSDIHGGALSHEQAVCQNPHGTFDVRPLQKVLIGLTSHASLPNQPENYVVADTVWQQNYRLSPDHLYEYLDSPPDLWGHGDRVLHLFIEDGFIEINQSLYLIKVSGLNLYKSSYNKPRASFIYSDISYDLAVTDPFFGKIVSEKKELMEILCISLGESFQGDCYKIVATIF